MKVGIIFPRYKYPSSDIPLGVCYLAAHIRKATNAEVDLFDTTFHKNKSVIKDIILKKKYDIIGISAMSSMIEDAFDIAKFIKKNNPKTFIIIGGPHATVLPTETIKNQYIDGICIGEGEITFAELIQKKGNPVGVNGIWYKSGNKIIKNRPRAPIENLNILPFPALNLINIEKYLKYCFQMDSVKRGLRGINLIASRGCPYDCSYCQPTLRKIFGIKVRKRSAKNIVNELKYLKNEYDITSFSFVDDTFVFDKNWVIEVCDLMKKEKLNLIWSCNSRANLVDEEMFTKMKNAGLRKVYMGIESGTQRILDEIYQKRITITNIREATKKLKKIKLKIQGYFMLGAPTETEKEIWKTIKLAVSLPIDEATFSITTPLPGTHLWDKTKEYVKKNVAEFDYYKISVYSKKIALSAKRIKRLKRIAFLSFYLSPRRLPNTIRGFLSLNEFKKSLMKLKRF